MTKRNKSQDEVTVPAAPEATVPAKPVVYVVGPAAEKASSLRANYVKAAWEATVRAMPCTQEALAELPEWQTAIAAVKGNNLRGYLAHWSRRGFIAEQD
jgi:hypothetical protein